MKEYISSNLCIHITSDGADYSSLPPPLPFSGSRSRAIEHHTFIDYFLRRGVNFINILPAVFMHADPKSAKIQSSCQSFLRFRDLQAQKPL